MVKRPDPDAAHCHSYLGLQWTTTLAGGVGRSVVCIQAAEQAAHGARRAARRAAGCDGPRRATMMTTAAMRMVTPADERDGADTNGRRNRGAEHGGAPPSHTVAVTHVLGPGHEVCGDAARVSSS